MQVKNNLCKCGCGTLVAKNYLHGHGRKGRKNSEAHNEALRKAFKGKPLSQETKNKISETKLFKKRFKEWQNIIFGEPKNKIKPNPISKEHRQKIVASLTGRKRTQEQKDHQRKIAFERSFGKWMIGKKLSPETCAKISKINKGRIVSESTRQKISEANKGEKNGMFGKKHPDHIKQKIGEDSKLHWTDEDVRNKMLNHPMREENCRKGAFMASLVLADKGFSNTKPERLFARILKRAKIEFIHPYPIRIIKHFYLADFFIPSKNLVVEVDGLHWHNYPIGREIDKIRKTELEQKGYKILRFWEYQFDGAIEQITKLENI